MRRWVRLWLSSCGLAAIAAACGGSSPAEPPCGKRVHVAIEPTSTKPPVEVERVRVCAGRCLTVDSACQFYEGWAADVSCQSGFLRIAFDVEKYPDQATLTVFDSTGTVVHSDSSQVAITPEPCEELYLSFYVNYSFGGADSG